MKPTLKPYLFAAFIFTLVISSCKNKNKPEPEEPAAATTKGILKITLVPKFNGAPFAFYTDYYNPLNQRIQFEILKFFVTNFYAKKTNGDSVLVKDAFKYDLELGLSSFTAYLDPAEFTGMSLAFGVDTNNNHLDPTLLDPSHPLSYNQANTMHWGWATGYIFMKCEAKADTSGTGTGPLSQFIAYHPGDDLCYYPTPFLPKTFSVSVGNTTELNLDFDVAKFITTTSDTIDLRVDNLTHFNDYPSLARKISENVSRSFAFE
jgi:hypothetical protein